MLAESLDEQLDAVGFEPLTGQRMIDTKLNVNVTNHPTNGIQTEGTLPAHHGEYMHLDEVGERQESLLTLGEPNDRQRSALHAT